MSETEKIIEMLGEGSAIFSYITGRPNDSIKFEELYELLYSEIEDSQSVFGPILIENEHPVDHVAKNGIGLLDADIHLLDHFITLTLIQDEVTEYCVLLPTCPGVSIGNLFDFQKLNDIANIFRNNCINVTQWVHIIPVGLSAAKTDQIPPMTYYRDVDDTELKDFSIKEDMCKNETVGENGRVIATIDGFENLLQSFSNSEDVQKIQEKLTSKDFMDISKDPEEIVEELMEMFKSVTTGDFSPFSMIEMQYGPIGTFVKMSNLFLMNYLIERTNKTIDNYNTKSKGGPFRKYQKDPEHYKNRKFTYIDGEFDLIKASQEADCEECGACDLNEKNLKENPAEDTESFFR